MRSALSVVPFYSAFVASVFAATPAIMPLSVSNEVVPAGAIAQIKVAVTEPAPISRGSAPMRFANSVFGPPVGIHLASPAGDALGTATIQNDQISFHFISPQLSAGTGLDYPILTVAVPVRSDAPVGATTSVTLDNISFMNSQGVQYPVEINQGSVQVGGSLAVSNVLPGAGMLSPNKVFQILGVGFDQNDRVKMEGFDNLNADIVNANTINASVPQAIDLENKRIRVESRHGGPRIEYFSYLRPNYVGVSSNPLIAATVPLFPKNDRTDALITPVLADPNQRTAMAVENIGSTAAAITVRFYNTSNVVVAQCTYTVPARSVLKRGAFEMFPNMPQQAGLLRVTSSQPVRMMGMMTNQSAGVVLPVSVSSVPPGF